ncbi:response regulator transcription factor [Clostridiaceae bacterium HSG29]|nr:response regulator transcription factor [Clostridiaceae bacterium HSG29]
MRILVVEDEKDLAKAIKNILIKNGYIVDVVHDGLEAYDYISLGDYDAILLDVMLPKLNGFEIVEKVRTNDISTPILMLTAKFQVDDKVKGLDLGADDYLAKPFDRKELLARLRSITRREAVFISDILTFGDISFNKDILSISNEKKEMKLSKKESQIFELLMINPNQIISKEQFTTKIWGYEFEGEYNQVEVYISFLRKKLKSIGSNVSIKVQRGIGYKLEVCDD